MAAVSGVGSGLAIATLFVLPLFCGLAHPK
jgi:hypothetical protein